MRVCRRSVRQSGDRAIDQQHRRIDNVDDRGTDDCATDDSATNNGRANDDSPYDCCPDNAAGTDHDPAASNHGPSCDGAARDRGTPVVSETVSQKNARQKAADYLDYTSFSQSGLIEQLKYEGFTEGDAAYAVDALNVDWNEQAAKKAAEYLDYTSFSHKGLVEQIVFEGFTQAQAEYGVSTTGL